MKLSEDDAHLVVTRLTAARLALQLASRDPSISPRAQFLIESGARATEDVVGLVVERWRERPMIQRVDLRRLWPPLKKAPGLLGSLALYAMLAAWRTLFGRRLLGPQFQLAHGVT